MSHLVSEESLRRFSAGTASSDEARLVMSHLLSQCSICAERLHRMSGREPQPALRYDRALDRFEDALRQSFGGPQAGGASPEALLAELDRMSPLQQEMLVRNSARYRSAGLCELLLDRSWARRFESPDGCLQSGRLAVLVADRLAASSPELSAVKDLHIRCLAVWSNALRIRGDLNEAQAAMATALHSLAAGGTSVLVEAWVYEIAGVLRNYQRRFSEATRFFRHAVEVHRDNSSPHWVARALVSQAGTNHAAGKPEVAVVLLREAIPKIGPGDPKLTLVACHNLIAGELKLGRIEQALLHWVELRPLYEEAGDLLMRIRQKWLEGELLLAQGILRPGLRLMELAHRQFLELGMNLDAAAISVEMALPYLKLGRGFMSQHLMRQAIPVFQGLGIQRELQKAQQLLKISRA